MRKTNFSLYLTLILHLSLSIVSYAQYQKDYVQEIAKYLGGQTEVTVTIGRIDILNDQYAIEVEFANKWKNSIGQSLWYGQQTGKTPGIVLVLKSKYDYKYSLQLNTTLNSFSLANKVKA